MSTVTLNKTNTYEVIKELLDLVNKNWELFIYINDFPDTNFENINLLKEEMKDLNYNTQTISRMEKSFNKLQK